MRGTRFTRHRWLAGAGALVAAAAVTLDAPLQLSVDPGIPAATALGAVDALPDTSITGRPLLAIDAAGPTPALEWRVPMTAPTGPGIARSTPARAGSGGSSR